MRRGMVAVATAALLALPVLPVSASTSMATCHPPRYDTWACVCGAVARAVTKLTGEPMYCAS